MAESSEEVCAAKRRRTFSEGEKPSFSKRHIKPAAESSAESSDVKSECTAKTEPTEPEGKRVTDGEQGAGQKDRKRKRSSVQTSNEEESELAAPTAKAAKAEDNSAEKSEISCQGADNVDLGDRVAKLNQGSKRSVQYSAEEVNQSAKKQKHANKLRKEKKCKNKQKLEVPPLRVISKSVVSLCIICYSIVYVH